MAVDNVFPSPS